MKSFKFGTKNLVVSSRNSFRGKVKVVSIVKCVTQSSEMTKIICNQITNH